MSAALAQRYDDAIQALVPINGLKRPLQSSLFRHGSVIELPRNEFAFREGDRDNYVLYLLDGELDMYSGSQLVGRLVGGTEVSRHAIAQIQPRRLSGRARTPVAMLKIERSLLDKLLILDIDQDRGKEQTGEPTLLDSGEWLVKVLKSELFVRIPPLNIKQIFERMEAVDVAAGSTVIKEGDAGDYYFIVQSGRCAVSRKLSPGSPPINLAELGPGNTFGEEALIASGKRNATVTMVSDGRLMRVSGTDFDNLIKEPTLKSVSYEDALTAVAEGAEWIDVRFAEERLNCGITGSKNFPLHELRKHFARFHKNKHYIVYCDTGSRSSVAAFLLTQHGINASCLQGGLIQSPMTDAIRGRMAGLMLAGRKSTDDARNDMDINKARRLITMLRGDLSDSKERLSALRDSKAQLERALGRKEEELENLKLRLEAGDLASSSDSTLDLDKELAAENSAQQEAERARHREELQQLRRAVNEAREIAAQKAEQLLEEYQEIVEEEMAEDRQQTEQRLAALKQENQALIAQLEELKNSI